MDLVMIGRRLGNTDVGTTRIYAEVKFKQSALP